jgi:hypothetical protein
MATTEDKKLIEKLLKKNRKWFERWMVFEDKIAADLTVVMRDLEVSKRNIVMRHVSRLALDENGVFLNSPDNSGIVLEMIRDVGKFNREMIEPGAPYTKWVTKNFEKSGLKGIAKALDTVKVADQARLPAKGYRARSAMKLVTQAQDMMFRQVYDRGNMDLGILRRTFMQNITDPQGNADTLRRALIDTGQIEGMLDSAGRRITADERADRIARYEPQTLSRKTHDESINDFYYDGEAPGLDEQFRLWDATMDNRTSSSHARRNGKVLTIEEWQAHDWGDGQHGLPPTRPRCRCDGIFVDPAWFSKETQEQQFTNRIRVTPLEQEIAA